MVSRDVEVSEELGKFITDSYTASQKYEDDIEKIPIVSTHIFDKKNSRKIMEKFMHSVDEVERAEGVVEGTQDILIFVFHSMIEVPKWLLEYANVTIIDSRTRPDVKMNFFFPFGTAGKVEPSNGWDTFQAIYTF